MLISIKTFVFVFLVEKLVDFIYTKSQMKKMTDILLTKKWTSYFLLQHNSTLSCEVDFDDFNL